MATGDIGKRRTWDMAHREPQDPNAVVLFPERGNATLVGIPENAEVESIGRDNSDRVSVRSQTRREFTQMGL
jgi:hypothetical protein